MLIDLDYFSWINNTLVHHVGESALVTLATRLTELCADDATIARFGGDKFVIWAPVGDRRLNDLAETMRAQKLMLNTDPDREITVHCSARGVTIGSGWSPTEAVRRADEAMCVVKPHGGSGVCIA
ncbi:MAG: GGDEF domain-containing protein [Acidimicrobiales bacterium]